jgi:hypothetical protein
MVDIGSITKIVEQVDKVLQTSKKSVQLDGVDPRGKKNINNSAPGASATMKGVDGDKLIEPVPTFIEAPSEKVISNTNNSWIVLGRDRPGPRSSGYGGKGDTQAASIDIVVGRMAHKAKSYDTKTGEQLWVDPDFNIDAARIYISQKTDLDKNFDLEVGKVGTSTAKSGICMKADGIRLVAREGIKLITSAATKNSQGGDIQGFVGVDIMAGNIDDVKSKADLQPIPKGNNLAEALERITFHIEKLNGVIDSFLQAQMEMNLEVTTHFHQSPFFAVPTTPSFTTAAQGIRTSTQLLSQTKRSLITHKANLALFKQTYLKQSGEKYINSRFNNVN